MRKPNAAPFIHCEDTVNTLYSDILVSLLPLVIISIVQNGLRVLFISTLSMLAGWLAQCAGNFVKGRGFSAGLQPAITGLILALLCPVTVPWWLPALGSVFSVVIIDVVMNEFYENLFSPPVIGWLFMLSIAPGKMDTYPMVGFFNSFPIFKSEFSFATSQSIAQSLQLKIKPQFDMVQILTGRVPGGMGTTCIIVMAAVMVFLFYRRAVAWQVTMSMIFAAAVIAVIFNRTGSGALYSILCEISASSYMFAAIFIAGNVTLSPKTSIGRVIYGVVIAVIVMSLRYKGITEYAVIFSHIVANWISVLCDQVALLILTGKAKSLKGHAGRENYGRLLS
ncbi:MAG TPA: RnfABCDGE type electron transport complex subunit D [Clostridiales bacterium]|nr:RnfABCDGE type electron transport complex subunit D [Clostridiales bacterium]